MIKLLLKQIWNERKSNTWLFFELLVVFVVLWYIVDWTYATARTYYAPLGFDIENTYLLRLAVKSDKCATYSTDSVHRNEAGKDMLEIIERLRRLPEVEAVAVSQSARPYTGSNSSISFKVDSIEFHPLRRPVTPDFFQVFRYENVDGTGWKNLAAALGPNRIVVSENLLPDDYKGNPTLMKRQLANPDDSTEIFQVEAVTHKVRYADFWANFSDKYAAVLLPESEIATLNEDMLGWFEVSLRVKSGTPESFPERIMEASDSQYTVGNVFVLGIKSYFAVRRAFIMSDVNEVKTRMWMLCFLLVNIFLGIIGTFWFRTQQRRSEMGLRIALGASRKRLWGELTGEGFMLLMLAMIVALPVCYYLGYADVTKNWPIEWGILRFLIGVGITFTLIGTMIFFGIWYPAHQVMHIHPADALHEE